MRQFLSRYLDGLRLPAVVRTFAALMVFTVFAAGWAFVLQQHDALWQRLPGEMVERFVADQVGAPLPQLAGATVLKLACARPLDWRAGLRRKWLREDLAACLNDPTLLVKDQNAQAAISQYQGMLTAQAAAADAWLAEFEIGAPASRARLQADLKGLQAHGVLESLVAPVLPWAGKFMPSVAQDVREVAPVSWGADAVVRNLREQVARTRAKVKALSDAQLPAGEQARELGLMATGLQLSLDYGDVPPSAQLGTARNTLADSLEWQRRARAYQERGFSLGQLKAVPLSLLASSVLLMLVVAFTARASLRAGVWGLWATATVVLGLGSVMLVDIALTGDASLRYLAVRQFLSFGLGDWWIPLGVALPASGWGALSGLVLWVPLLVLSGVLLCLRALGDGAGWLMAPVRGWVHMASDAHWGWSVAQAFALLLLGLALVFFLGMPAAVSELLILLGCVGVATYVARQATYANLGAGLQGYSLLAVASALVLAVGGALMRGDLGHALVALALAACFAWLFGGVWLRWSLVASVVAGVVCLVACQIAGELVGPLAWVTGHLPPHAQDRMLAMFDPFHAGASDMARIHWLIQSAGDVGWGVGYVPWQGLSPVRTQDGLPLQGPSDYVLALSTSLWGQTGGLLPMLAVMVLFGGAAVLGLRTALAAAMPRAVRWLAATGALGCVMMVVKVVLSVGGVTGVLPLTGLPVSLLGYGPVTHLAALVYLALALGTLHVRPEVLRRGVNLNDTEEAEVGGAVQRRAVGLAWVGAACLAAVLGLGWQHLHASLGEKGVQHVSKARFDMAQAVALSLVPIVTPMPGSGAKSTADLKAVSASLPCEQLAYAQQAWNHRVGQLSRPVFVAAIGGGGGGGGGRGAGPQLAQNLQLDLVRLQALVQADQPMKCRVLARTLGHMLDSDLPRLVGNQAVAEGSQTGQNRGTAVALGVFDKPRALGARHVDYSTANAWWGRPGCLWQADALGRLDAKQAKAAVACGAGKDASAARIDVDALGRELLTDVWLQRHLAPQLSVAQRTPTDTALWNHHAVAVGPVLGVTLQPTVQQLTQRIADCATGRLKGADCAEVLPRDAVWRQRQYLDEGALRAGAMGIVVAEVDTGRIVGMAGAVSDCSLDKLARTALVDPEGTVSALTAGSPCAQLPDKRSAYLAQQHPVQWMLPPGSSLKPFSVVAGIDGGLIAAGQDAYWKGILAESHERLPVQRVALAAGQRYLDVLTGLGFGQARIDLLWGGVVNNSAPTPFRARWATDAYDGTQGLRPTSMSLARAEEIRSLKGQGVNVDKRFGEVETREFVAARRLADAALGGGDIRINALGLVDAWRALDLRARGHGDMKSLHILEQPAHTVSAKMLNWMGQSAASRTLGVTSGVTASGWKGTAQGSCRVVFGSCPPQGLPGLSGKTGSADFLTEEDGPFVKTGMQLPAKLFGGVFTAADGKRYAVAAMALRVREGKSRSLELKSSAPAEAALTVMRQMGVSEKK